MSLFGRQSPRRVPRDPNFVMLYCPRCGKKESSEAKNNQHATNAHGSRPFLCWYEDCEATFTNITNLKKHMMRSRVDGNPHSYLPAWREGCWMCPVCERNLDRKHKALHWQHIARCGREIGIVRWTTETVFEDLVIDFEDMILGSEVDDRSSVMSHDTSSSLDLSSAASLSSEDIGYWTDVENLSDSTANSTPATQPQPVETTLVETHTTVIHRGSSIPPVPWPRMSPAYQAVLSNYDLVDVFLSPPVFIVLVLMLTIFTFSLF